jgi:L-alanine-DL-glutamate epimerase-like enolase superfamily enzyme
MRQQKEFIRQINIYHCPIRLKEPFVISLGQLEFADNVIIIIKTSGGISGFGECSPFQTIHGENGDTCMAVGRLLAEKLIGEDALDINHCVSRMDAIIFGNTSIKSAFDIALHDIAAQKNNQPLYKFLGGEKNRELFTDYTVSIGDAAKMANDAARIVEAGFPVIKIKLGGKPSDDFQRMKMIRERVGNEIPVRIDANQGWSPEDVIPLLDMLYPFNIQHCEEPISKRLFLKLPEIKKQSKIPIMADESCFDDIDAERLIAMDACDLINVKLGKSSGILKAKKICQLAENTQMNLQAGGFLESRLGFTAMAHLALSCKQFLFFDFDTPLMFVTDPVTGGIAYHEKGKIIVPETPGLGATINEEVLKKLKKIELA